MTNFERFNEIHQHQADISRISYQIKNEQTDTHKDKQISLFQTI